MSLSNFSDFHLSESSKKGRETKREDRRKETEAPRSVENDQLVFQSPLEEQIEAPQQELLHLGNASLFRLPSKQVPLTDSEEVTTPWPTEFETDTAKFLTVLAEKNPEYTVRQVLIAFFAAQKERLRSNAIHLKKEFTTELFTPST